MMKYKRFSIQILLLLLFCLQPLHASEPQPVRDGAPSLPLRTRFSIVGIIQVEEDDQASSEKVQEISESSAQPASGEKSETIDSGENVTLKKVEKLAENRNLELKIANEKIFQAKARHEQLKSNKRLQGNVEAASAYIGPSHNLYIDPPIDMTIQFDRSYSHYCRATLQYVVTTFGKIENQIAASLLGIGAEYENLEVKRQEVIYNSKVAFFNILRAQSRLKVAQDYHQSTMEHLGVSKSLYKEGIVSRYDVVNAELGVSKAGLHVVTAEKYVVLTKSTLLTLLNIAQRIPFNAIPPAPVKVDSGVKLEELQQTALRNRPEIRSLAVSIEATKKLLDAAWALKSPDISLSAHYDRLTGTFVSDDNSYSLMVAIRIPILDGGMRNGKVSEAQSSIRSLEYSVEGLEKQILLEVEQAWLDLNEAFVNIETSEQNVITAMEGYRMAKARYLHGMSISVEIQDAMRALNDAKEELVDANYNYNTAFSALEKSLGCDIPDRHLKRSEGVNPENEE